MVVLQCGGDKDSQQRLLWSVSVNVRVQTHAGICILSAQGRQKRVLRPSGAGVIGSRGLPDVGAGNQTGVLSKSSNCS